MGHGASVGFLSFLLYFGLGCEGNFLQFSEKRAATFCLSSVVLALSVLNQNNGSTGRQFHANKWFQPGLSNESEITKQRARAIITRTKHRAMAKPQTNTSPNSPTLIIIVTILRMKNLRGLVGYKENYGPTTFSPTSHLFLHNTWITKGWPGEENNLEHWQKKRRKGTQRDDKNVPQFLTSKKYDFDPKE